MLDCAPDIQTFVCNKIEPITGRACKRKTFAYVIRFTDKFIFNNRGQAMEVILRFNKREWHGIIPYSYRLNKKSMRIPCTTDGVPILNIDGCNKVYQCFKEVMFGD